jgi:hypothetical protein
MSSSLDILSKNLEKIRFVELSKYFPKEHLNLITKKLAYPYEFMDCLKKFQETQLPPIEKLYSSLNNEHVNKEDYENAQKIWNTLKIKNMQEFTNLYIIVDVLLLADVMESFRDVALQNYKLDPAWYFTTPGFAWDAMLQMTKQSLELLTDYNKVLFIEKGIRGGLPQCSNTYAKANNK